MTVRLAAEQLPYATPPFSVEFIASRPVGEQWRIHDARDNAVGSAATRIEARNAARMLNLESQP